MNDILRQGLTKNLLSAQVTSHPAKTSLVLLCDNAVVLFEAPKQAMSSRTKALVLPIWSKGIIFAAMDINGSQRSRLGQRLQTHSG